MSALSPQLQERLSGQFAEVQTMIEVLAAAVTAADFYLNSPTVTAKDKAMTRALVEEAMGLLRPRP